MSDSNGAIIGAPNLALIDALVQFKNGTQAIWNDVSLPIPAGFVVYAKDTTAIKMGDGATLYADLPVLFYLNTISTLGVQMSALLARLANIGLAIPYSITVFIPGTMSDGQVLLAHQFSQAVTFPANFTAAAFGGRSKAGALAAAAASTVIAINRCPAASDPTNPANFTNVGNITFGLGGHIAVMSTSGSAAISFATDDWLELVIVTADSNLANFSATLIADRN